MPYFRKPKQSLIFFFFVALTTACATGSLGPKAGPPKSKSVIESQTRTLVSSPIFKLSEPELRSKMKRFQLALSRGTTLSVKDWQLHDELLNAYIQLKDQSFAANRITIPAHGRLKLELPSFCLNSSRASPSDSERFVWRKADPKIPYYREILNYAAHHPKRSFREEIQTLLWNLQNETRWENYPDRLKAILHEIDPQASTKLPSKLKDTLKDTAADLITSHLPFGSDARDTIDLVKGEYYRFEDVRRSIEQMKSNYPLEPSDELESIPDSTLYAETESQGFSQQTVTFYNPSDKPATLDLTDYYLDPKRKDVQRIALISSSPTLPAGLLADLEQLLYGDMLRLGIGFTPGLNDVADLYELVFGKDFVSQEKLGNGSRLLSGIGLIAGSGAGYRYAMRIAHSPAQYLPEFKRGFSKVSKREIELTELSQREGARLTEETQQTVSKLERSPTLERIYKDHQFRKTDFYVRSDGAVLPAKGYRYIRSDAEYLGEIAETGKIPSNLDPRGTYVSFNDYSSSREAALKLQVKHDAAIKVEFNTAQIADDLQIPKGQWGSAEYLEPITRDYPGFGEGGATQAVTHLPIQAEKITDLRTGRTLYEKR